MQQLVLGHLNPRYDAARLERMLVAAMQAFPQTRLADDFATFEVREPAEEKAPPAAPPPQAAAASSRRTTASSVGMILAAAGLSRTMTRVWTLQVVLGKSESGRHELGVGSELVIGRDPTVRHHRARAVRLAPPLPRRRHARSASRSTT